MWAPRSCRPRDRFSALLPRGRVCVTQLAELEIECNLGRTVRMCRDRFQGGDVAPTLLQSGVQAVRQLLRRLAATTL
ncbi:MAG TPA: hypothetical protein VF909_15145 [Roseiflexaceae bacterium]